MTPRAASTKTFDPARRRWLRGSVAFAGLALAGAPARMLASDTRGAYPFTLGVASGDPTADGFVLWTRLAPFPTAPGGGMPPYAVAVVCDVAEDPAFARVVRSEFASAVPERAHAVHVDVGGLRSDREYHYRFRVGDAVTATGRARTLPAAGLPVDEFRFAVASCQHYEHGWFAAHRHIAASAPQLVLHLGDYIYEGSFGEAVRRFERSGPITTLADYRARHAWYKLDPDLQAAHAACAWAPIWDDHEVANDYAGDAAIDGESAATFALRRGAAYQAWLEHMPVRAALRSRDMRIFRRLSVGALADIHLLDDRQYRTPQPCVARGAGYAPMIDPGCAERSDPARSLLGPAQERWLHLGLSASSARWNLIAQQTLLAPFVQRAASGAREVWSDAWDGYAQTRQRLLDHVAERAIPNVVTFGGDVHAFYVNDLKRDFDDPSAAAIATEFVTSSLTTAEDGYDAVVRDLPLNPHVKYFDNRVRGWLDCRLSADGLHVDLRALDDARNPRATAYTLAQFDVVNGVAGAAAS